MNNDKLRFCYNVVSVTSVNKLWFMGVGMGKVDYIGGSPPLFVVGLRVGEASKFSIQFPGI